MMRYPAASAAWYTLFIAIFLCVTGVRRIVFALQLRRFMRGWAWPLCTGIAAVVLGLFIYSEWPWSGLWAIWLFVALELLLHGASMVSVALAAGRRRGGQ